MSTFEDLKNPMVAPVYFSSANRSRTGLVLLGLAPAYRTLYPNPLLRFQQAPLFASCLCPHHYHISLCV